MELVNKWFPNDFFRKVDTPFRKDSKYEKELMAELPLTGNSLHKAEIEDHRKIGHTLGRIQKISLMGRIGIYYTALHLVNQTVAHAIPSF